MNEETDGTTAPNHNVFSDIIKWPRHKLVIITDPTTP